MTFPPLLPQKLDYNAYSSNLYGNDRIPLQYSGYYPVPGYHAPPASFNIGNINFGKLFTSAALPYFLQDVNEIPCTK